MIFLTEDDLKSQIFEILLRESSDDFTEVLDSLELQNIALMQSYLSGRYDTTAIFAVSGSNRNNLIIKVLVSLTLYDLIRRNAARKVPSDYVDRQKWAMKWLSQVQATEISPIGLPINTDAQDNLNHGSNKNVSWYSY